MVDSLNKVMLIGNVGDDPKISELTGGSKKVASFSLATSHSWMGANGERQTHTDWHRIVVYGEGLVGIIEKIKIRKGTKLFVEGKLATRKWVDKDKNNRSTVEVVLQGYNCSIVVLSSSNNGSSNGASYDRRIDTSNSAASAISNKAKSIIEDDNFDDFMMSSEFGLSEEEDTLSY